MRSLRVSLAAAEMIALAQSMGREGGTFGAPVRVDCCLDMQIKEVFLP